MASSSRTPAKVQSSSEEEKDWDVTALRFGLQSPPRRYRDIERFRLPNAAAEDDQAPTTSSGGGSRRRRKKAAKPKLRKPPIRPYKRIPQVLSGDASDSSLDAADHLASASASASAQENGGSNDSTTAAEVFDPEVAVATDEEEEEVNVGDDDDAPFECDDLAMPIPEGQELILLQEFGWKQDEAHDDAALTQEEIESFYSLHPDKRKQRAAAADAQRPGGA